MSGKTFTRVHVIPSDYTGEKEWVCRHAKDQQNNDVTVFFQRARKSFNILRACSDLINGITKARANIISILGNQIGHRTPNQINAPAAPYTSSSDKTDADRMLHHLSSVCEQDGVARFDLVKAKTIDEARNKPRTQIREVTVWSLKPGERKKKLELQVAIQNLRAEYPSLRTESQTASLIKAAVYCIDHNNNIAVYKSDKEKLAIANALDKYIRDIQVRDAELSTLLNTELTQFKESLSSAG